MKAFPKDIEVTTLTERHIGIESELYVGEDGDHVPSGVEQALHEQGLLQSIGYDGGGREFRTNPISIKSILKQKKGQAYLTAYYAVLKANTRVTEYGGTHIHISILDSDHKNMESNAVALAEVFYTQFQKIAGRQSHWAKKLSQRCGQSFTNIDEIREYIAGRTCESWSGENKPRTYVMKGSILGPTGHKTLEFRGPVGSNDSEEILAWVEFLDIVVKTANRKSVHGVQFMDLITGPRISEYVKKLDGWRVLTDAELTKTVNEKELV